MKKVNIVFFGSTDDSVNVLEKLFFPSHRQFVTLSICCIVTQPPRPVGRKQVSTRTPVELWATAHNTTVLSFPSDPDRPWLYAHEEQVIDALQPLKADLLVSACYGQHIPIQAIQAARYGGLNVHPSLLPRWRGADPVPWAIVTGDHQTGVTIVTLSEKFDDGRIIAQKKIPITDTDTSDTLRTKLFTIGADLLTEILPEYLLTPHKLPKNNPSSPPLKVRGGRVGLRGGTYARRLTRDDGFEPWDAIQKALEDPKEARRIDRKFRAFFPWPGLWTKIGERRLKILSLHLSPITYSLSLDVVQWEGKNPIPYSPLLTAASGRLHLD